MAGATVSNHDAILQENYGNVHEILQYATPVINMLPTSSKKPDGRQFRELITNQHPASFGFYGPNMAATPDAQTAGYTEAIYHQCYGYGALKIDWVLIEHNSGDHSYVDALNNQMRLFTKFQAETMEKWAVSDGSGRLGADTSGVLASNTYRGRVVRTATAPLTVKMYGSHNAVWFREGMAVEFMYDASTPGVGSESAFNTWEKRDTPAQGYFTVASIAVTKSATAASDIVTITMNENVVGAGNDPGDGQTGDYDVIIADEAISPNTSTGSLNETRIPYGLDALIDDGNAVMQTQPYAATMQLSDTSLHGISASNSWWQSEVADGTSSYFSLDLAQEVCDGIARRSGSGSEGIRFLVADHFQARKYSLSLTAQERYPNTGSVGKFKSGTSTMFNSHHAVDIAEKPMVKSRFQLRDRVHFVGKGIKQYTLKPWGWISKDGIWHRDFNYGTNYQAVASTYTQLGTTDRSASGKVENLLSA